MNTSTVPHHARRAMMALLLAIALVASATPRAANAATDGSAEARFVALTNEARTGNGLAGLAVAGDLTAVARRHSARMADADDLHHNPNLGSDVAGWEVLGENVGVGPQADRIHTAFLDSPGHRANILEDRYTEVGVGVERRGDRMWVTVVFRLPETAAATPETPPAADPAPVAAPAPAAVAPSESAVAPSEPADEPAVEPAPVAAAAAPTVRSGPIAVDRGTAAVVRLAAEEAPGDVGALLASLVG